jgi:DNA-binding transcriptional MerR regulator
MRPTLTIGDFSRMTHLSVKALRHYHDLGLLDPAEVDLRTGYRLYDATQVPIAQLIRRYRDLDMPVEHVKAVLAATDPIARNELIIAHLKRMESQLEQTQTIVASLRTLLESQSRSLAVEYRSIPQLRVAAITKTVKRPEIEPWWSDSFAEIYHALRTAGVMPAGPSGGIYPTELFIDEIAEVTVFVPTPEGVKTTGNIRIVELPAVDLAIALHDGPLREADRTYGPLGTHVTERALGAEGPIREHYLITDDDVANESALRTEIGWPIVRITSAEEQP